MKLCLLVVILFFHAPVFAGDNFSKLHGFQVFYSGEEKETFSNDNAGTGLEVVASTMNERYNWIATGRLTSVSGSQDFADGAATVNSDFTFYQSSFEGGFTVYPLLKKKRALNLYFGATGIMSFNYLKLDATTFTVLDPSYQAASFGYSGLVGIEWYIFGAEKWCLSAEFAQRYETAGLAKKSGFNLGGFSLAFGLGW